MSFPLSALNRHSLKMIIKVKNRNSSRDQTWQHFGVICRLETDWKHKKRLETIVLDWKQKRTLEKIFLDWKQKDYFGNTKTRLETK